MENFDEKLMNDDLAKSLNESVEDGSEEKEANIIKELDKIQNDPAYAEEKLKFSQFIEELRKLCARVVSDDIGEVEVEVNGSRSSSYLTKKINVSTKNLIKSCGLFELAFSECSIRSFGSNLTIDNDGKPSAYIEMDLNYQSWDGGFNGTIIGQFRFDNGKWKVTKSKYKH